MDAHGNDVIAKIDKMLKHYKSQQLQSNKQYIEQLPVEFITFLKQKQIDVKQLAVPIPRYVRIKPQYNLECQQLAKSLNIDEKQLIKIDDEFYALPPSVKINNCKYYQEGLLYGMDYSSCIPVRCLDAQQNQTILQLCSAPGNKSMYLADSTKNVKIIGVQINMNRANVMKNLITKYKLDHLIEVRVEDGLKFDSQQLFDRVLVDAECTHQGSIKHIKKFMPLGLKSKPNKNQIKAKKQLSKQQQKQFQINNSNPYTTDIKKNNEWSFQDFKQRFLDERKLNNLQYLQSGLLQNGFRLLKQDGILVYSTCSFDQSQNQGIIQKLLAKHEKAQLLDCKKQLKCAVDFEMGIIKQTIRFSPSVSRCGGMFVCKIKKNKTDTKKQQQISV